jgi:type IV secretory pathway component VirB8
MKNNLTKDSQEYSKEYSEFIKGSVESGDFFKDSFDWYTFRYAAPLCDRTWLFFVTIASVVISYVLMNMVTDMLPIAQKVPIVIVAKDTTLYYPQIKGLKNSQDVKTVDEAVIKYLLVKYIENREEYNFSKMTTNHLNKKFNVIKNNSTLGEYKRFKEFLNLNNKNSPIKDFGKNVSRKIAIKSFSFKRGVNKDFISKARDFVYSQVPTQADVNYDLTISGEKGDVVKSYLVKISFKFSKIDPSDLNKKIIFQVSDYKLFVRSKKKK